MSALLRCICAIGLVGCARFDEFAGLRDAGHESHEASVDAREGASRDARAESGADSPSDAPGDAPRDPCATPWLKPAKGEGCATRRLFPVVTSPGGVRAIRLARAFGGEIALLYDATTSSQGQTVDALTLALVDDVAQRVTSSVVVASATAFDAIALAYDDAGTLSVAYHAGDGAPVSYVVLDAGLEASAPEEVATDAGRSLLALSPIPAGDAGAGPLGTIAGSVGLAWYAAPTNLTDAADATLHFFARAVSPSSAQWTEVETYGYSPISAELSLHPNPQLGVVAASIARTFLPVDPDEICTWQMAGHMTHCGFQGTVYGLSLATEPGATHLVYTYEDPLTLATTLAVATDTDGTYTFPLLTNVATFSDSPPGSPAIPRAAVIDGNVAIALVYQSGDDRFNVDYVAAAGGGTASPELVTQATSTNAMAPPFDFVVDQSGAAVLAVADAASGQVLLARAAPGPSDGSSTAP